MPKTVKRTILDWHNLASEYGGKCLSKKAAGPQIRFAGSAPRGTLLRRALQIFSMVIGALVCGRIVAGTTRHRKAIARVEAIIKEKKGKLLTPPSEIDSMAILLSTCLSCRTHVDDETVNRQIRQLVPRLRETKGHGNAPCPLRDLRAYAASKGGRIVKVVRGVGMRGVYS